MPCAMLHASLAASSSDGYPDSPALQMPAEVALQAVRLVPR